jgi:hypothetical protein
MLLGLLSLRLVASVIVIRAVGPGSWLPNQAPISTR